MSIDGINRLSLMRSLYKAQETSSSNDVVRILQDIKNEIKIANDEQQRQDLVVSNATGSPYLTDQITFNKNIVYNSPAEGSWRDVKSFEQTKKEIEDRYVELNKRKLDII